MGPVPDAEFGLVTDVALRHQRAKKEGNGIVIKFMKYHCAPKHFYVLTLSTGKLLHTLPFPEES